jgi:hypothetical protein
MSPVGFVLRAHGTSGVPVQVTIGPDGFVANSELDNYAAHVRLTEYLQERQADGGKAIERVLPRLRKELSKSELVALIRAIHARIVWIAEHDGELSDPGRWQTGKQVSLKTFERAFATEITIARVELHFQVGMFIVDTILGRRPVNARPIKNQRVRAT